MRCHRLPNVDRVQTGAERRSISVRFSELLRAASGAPVVGPLLDRGRERRALGGLRLDPGRRALLAMLAVAVLTIGAAGFWVLSARPHRITAPPSAAPAQAGSVSPGGSLMSPVANNPSSAASGTLAPSVVVDVVGKVHRPGVYKLSAGSRVDDAVSAAGGVLAGVDPVSVNLARKLADGEQIVVGMTTAPGVSAAGNTMGASSGNPVGGTSGVAPAGAPTPGTPIDLNVATAAQLDALPGVGPVLAQRIVDWRTQHGRFDTVDQLQDVSGIGDAKYADLKSLVTVG